MVKKSRSLNDTAAICSPAHDSDHMSMHVSIEKLDNGYVKRASHYKDGEHKSSATFHSEKPSLDYDKSSPDKGNAMARAKSYLEKR